MKHLLFTGLMLTVFIVHGQSTKHNKTMNSTAIEVFQSFGEGMMSGTDVWKDYLADDINFIGPVDQVQGKEAFITLNESFMPMMRGSKMHQIIEKDNWVITQVAFDVAMPSGQTITLEMSEWYEIKDNQIQSIKVYYDAEEFRKHLTPTK
ncbi:MAG: nuclear transport factor 2 family protein [Reichenbachiella sp.]|uniref:nuclear transport factor 2 family protein n=1 Tax=Reichenbachiella sp. TaxID=2184521 RepID=UPI00326570F0